MIACWANYDYDQALRLARSLLQRDANASFAHWIRLLSLPSDDQLRQGHFDDVASSYNWLRERVPDQARDLHQIYVRMLAHAQADPEWLDRLSQRIQVASDTYSLVDLAPLLHQMKSEQRRRIAVQILSRARQLQVEGTQSPPQAADLQRLLSEIAGWDYVSLDERLEVVVAWLPQYLRTSFRERRAMSCPSLAMPPTLLEQLTSSLQKALETDAQRVGETHVLSAHGLESDPQARIALRHGQRLLQILQGDGLRQMQLDGSLTVTSRNAPTGTVTQDEAPALFPAPSTWLDRPTVNTLVQLSALGQLPAAQQRLMTSLRTAAKEWANDHDTELAMQLGCVVLNWSWGDEDSALRLLEEIVQAEPANDELKLTLLRANLQRGNLETAQTLMEHLLASSSERQEVQDLQTQLWKRWTAQTHWQDFVGHDGAVSALAVHPDGQLLASAGVDGLVRIWDVATGQLVRTLEGHNDIALTVAFSPDGRQLASAGYDRIIHRWRTDDGAALRTSRLAYIRSAQPAVFRGRHDVGFGRR